MPALEDNQGIQRLLGMVNYVAKFGPQVSGVTAPLRELLKKDVAWHWTERHEQSFHDIKRLLTETSSGVLKYYDPKLPVELQVDACKSGLCAVLVQDGSPIAYASRSLTETECKYTQFEKELLAVTFGCERFHQYIYAKRVMVLRARLLSFLKHRGKISYRKFTKDTSESREVSFALETWCFGPV